MNSKHPVTHPDYFYSPAKNPYADKLKEHPLWAYSDQATEAHAGKWRSRFRDVFQAPPSSPLQRELIVEIGCNTGHVVRAWAEQFPQKAFIGIDWKFKPIYRGVEKAQKKELRNIIFMRGNVERIHFMFAPEEISELHMYFPDPWPKKSQKKHRTLKEVFLKNASIPLKKGGIFFIKTDHLDYFEWIQDELKKIPEIFEIEKKTTDLHQNHPSPEALKIPEVTLFETLFIRDQIPIKAIWLRKK